ncbi:MAG: segregation/condensation protein A [Desulfuromonadales bacterium]|nr:segregation/condensation protein A [Desulfuromonadales bacterium]
MDAFAIRLENFEGPLDLLLHLIKKNEVEITDIPMAQITAQYLAIIDAMQTLNLDVAGEFLLMAATLLHIKSRMLLPKTIDEEETEEEDDPRAELVRRLLEYQKYKEAAVEIDQRPQLERDLFARTRPEPELSEESESEFVAVSLFDLVQALAEVLRQSPEPVAHEVDVERLSVTERITQVLERLHGQESLAFKELFPPLAARSEVIVTFLAMLELVKMRLVRLMQNQRFGSIWLFPAVAAEDASEIDSQEESLGYC